MSEVIERFLRYVAIDTESADDREQIPSTEKQFDLARVLKAELEEMGAEHVRLSDQCYVYATIPATTKKDVPSIGLIAHMDTSNAVSGKDVKARIVKEYDGTDICLNEALGYVLSPKEYPDLETLVGKDLIVTDGTTLLGADDKAGVAEIMAAAFYLLKHPEIEHGRIQIGFTPDEEVGRGVDGFDVEGFGAEFAYTMDGGALGEIEYENFNALNVHVEIKGKSIHPGSAKGKMVNSILIGMEFQNMLPEFENPACTEGYEGFFHLCGMEGGCEKTTLSYIVRDHDMEKFQKKVELLHQIEAFLNAKYGEGTVTVQDQISYYNMKEKILPHMHLINDAKKALEELGVEAVTVPIRGGTDGARLSFMGLPCPNLCTGGYNYHGRYEYACVQSMETCVEMIIKIVTAPCGGTNENGTI